MELISKEKRADGKLTRLLSLLVKRDDGKLTWLLSLLAKRREPMESLLGY